jgi:hypothetical protein
MVDDPTIRRHHMDRRSAQFRAWGLNAEVRKLVAGLLLVVCPGGLMAEQPIAMLDASGDVTLNGTPARASTSVFAGDRIDTASASVVSINSRGTALVVDPLSSIQYEANGFTILKGTTRVRTSRAMIVHAGPLSVMPKANQALFDISNDGKTVLVASRQGVLTLIDGMETASLPPGYSARVSLESSKDDDVSPKPAGTTKGEGGNRRKKVLIVILASGAAAAAIACIVACGAGGAAPTTPVTP